MGKLSCDFAHPGDHSNSTWTPTLAAVGREAHISRCPQHSPARSIVDSSGALAEQSRQRGSGRKSNNKRRKTIDDQTPHHQMPAHQTWEAKKRDDNRSPWILHFCPDVLKTSAFDEQFQGQLRSSRTSHKLGQLVHSMDVETYAKLSHSSPFNLIKLIYQTFQNVNVHKKPCDELAHYLRAIDDVISPLRKSLESGNASDCLGRVLAVLQETLAAAYILVRSCENRTPVYSGSFNNIPAKINAVEGQLQRIIPVLRRAILHQNLHQNLLPVARGSSMRRANADDITSDAASRSRSSQSSAAASMKENSVDSSIKARMLLDNYRQLAGLATDEQSSRTGKSSRQQSRQRNLIDISPWRLDVHNLTLLRRPMQTYTCKACNKIGEGCVYCCARCDYNVHPECVELNDAIQRLEEISLTKLSGIES